MSDSSNVVKGAEAIGAIVKAVPVYQDAFQPAAKEAGQTLALPLQVVNTALRPVKTILSGLNTIFDRLDERMKEKLKGKPPEMILEPPLQVAGQLLMAYPFIEPEPDLRDMFEELLAKAMLKDTRDSIHPSFIETLKQITPREAQVIRGIPKYRAARPMFRISTIIDPKTMSFVHEGFFWAVPGIDPDIVDWVEMNRLLDNLRRLRLLEIPYGEHLHSPEAYNSLRSLWDKRPMVAAIEPMIVQLKPVSYIITPFGASFMDACLPLTTETQF